MASLALLQRSGAITMPTVVRIDEDDSHFNRLMGQAVKLIQDGKSWHGIINLVPASRRPEFERQAKNYEDTIGFFKGTRAGSI